MLSLEGVDAFYGKAIALEKVSLRVGAGEHDGVGGDDAEGDSKDRAEPHREQQDLEVHRPAALDFGPDRLATPEGLTKVPLEDIANPDSELLKHRFVQAEFGPDRVFLLLCRVLVGVLQHRVSGEREPQREERQHRDHRDDERHVGEPAKGILAHPRRQPLST